MNSVERLPTLIELRRHILPLLCKHDQLDPEHTPLHQAVILRRGQPCGLFFQVEGPRLLKTYAVWADEENRILFYDGSGNRFFETKLSEGPNPRRLKEEASDKLAA